MPSGVAELIQKRKLEQQTPEPVFLDLSFGEQEEQFAQLLAENDSLQTIDTYESQLKELFVIQNPSLNLFPQKRDEAFIPYRDKHFDGKQPYQAGKWVYLPWRNIILHILPDDDFQTVRTARNRNLITAEEQQAFYNSTIGIAGLSVGNSCALALVLTGGGKRLRLADPDTLELTNLNRIRGSIAELTMPKVHMTARQIYELDPYADLMLYTDGLTEENIEAFFDGPPKLDVVIDEIDDIGMKVRIRQEAKKRNIPVVMAADNGDGGIIDVERHDLEDTIAPFHGRAGDDIAGRTVGKKLPLPVIGQIITESLLGAENITNRVQQSLLEIGSTLPTWPQLGGAAVLNGVAVAMTVRRILNNQPAINNRAMLSLESWLIPEYGSAESVARHQEETKKFLEEFHKRLAQVPPPENK